MTERYFPFDAGPGADSYEDRWQKMARRWLATGVIPSYLNSLAPSASGSALAVAVATGGAWVEGFYYETDAPLSVALAAAHPTLPRIDRIVVRLDRTANTIVVDKLTGTAAGTPAAPALTQTDTLWEMVLADVAVGAAVGVITSGNVTDRRAFTGDARLILRSQFDAKGDLLVGTADDTFTRVPIGADGDVLVADSTAPSGMDWASASGLLGHCQYDPASAVTRLISTLAFAALDTTNLRATFVAPASGTVKVDFGAWGSSNGHAADGPIVGILDGSTVKAASGYQGQGAADSVFGPISVSRIISGLTPGTTYTWDLAYASSGAGINVSVVYGGGDNGNGAAYLFISAA